MKYEDKIGTLFIHTDSAELPGPRKPHKGEGKMTIEKLNAIEDLNYLWGLSIAMAITIGFSDNDIDGIGNLFVKVNDYLLSTKED